MPPNTIMQRSPLSQGRRAMPGLLTCSLRHAAVMPQAPELPEPPTRGCCPCSSSLLPGQRFLDLISPRGGILIWPSMPQPCPLIAGLPTAGGRGAYPSGQGEKAVEVVYVSTAGPACGPRALEGVILRLFPTLASRPGPQVLPSSPLSPRRDVFSAK